MWGEISTNYCERIVNHKGRAVGGPTDGVKFEEYLESQRCEITFNEMDKGVVNFGKYKGMGFVTAYGVRCYFGWISKRGDVRDAPDALKAYISRGAKQYGETPD